MNSLRRLTVDGDADAETNVAVDAFAVALKVFESSLDLLKLKGDSFDLLILIRCCYFTFISEGSSLNM